MQSVDCVEALGDLIRESKRRTADYPTRELSSCAACFFIRMARATLDAFITADEAKLQLGLDGATLDQSIIARIDNLRAVAVEDLEDVMELLLLGRQKSYEGRIKPGSRRPFSVPFTKHFESVASILYRTDTDQAHEMSGQIDVNSDITIESTDYEGTGGKLFLVCPDDKWPANAHEDGDAILTLNAGIDAALLPLTIPKRHKEYLLLQLSGYFDSRVTAGGSMGGMTRSLDHSLAADISRRLTKGVSPTWEKMKAAAAGADRISVAA